VGGCTQKTGCDGNKSQQGGTGGKNEVRIKIKDKRAGKVQRGYNKIHTQALPRFGIRGGKSPLELETGKTALFKFLLFVNRKGKVEREGGITKRTHHLMWPSVFGWGEKGW